MRYFFAPWTITQLDSEGGVLLTPPPGAALAFDFYAHDAKLLPLFASETVPTDAVVLGNGPEGRADLSAIRRVLGGGLDVVDGRVFDVVWRLLTMNPQAAWNGLLPALNTGELHLTLPGNGVEQRTRFAPGEHPSSHAAIRRNYRAMRARADGSSARHLWMYANRMRLSLRDVVDEDLSLEEPVRPSTLHTETWTASNTSQGSSNALDADQDWHVLWGDKWEINNNRARLGSTDGDPDGEPARCEATVLADHHVKARWVRTSTLAGSRFAGVTFRHSAENGINTDDNRRYEVRLGINGDIQIYRNTAEFGESYTQLGSTVSTGAGWGAEEDIDVTIRGAAEGTSLEAWMGDTKYITVTDTTYQTQVRGGVTGYGELAALDDWEISDQFPVVSKGRSHAVVVH